MKILSGRQPWWWMVLHLGKSVENRSRRVIGSHQGPILLHASAWKSHRQEWSYWQNALRWVEEHVPSLPIGSIPAFDSPAMQYGGIVGVVDITGDILCPDPSVSGELAASYLDRSVSCWWMRDQFGYLLANPKPLPFTAWKGSLGVQTASVELLQKLGLGF
jgi:hypothetical protein